MKKKVLLFSSSKAGDSGFLIPNLPHIESFLRQMRETLPTYNPPVKKPLEVLFIPYAGVSIDHDMYYQRVKTILATLKVEVKSLHHYQDVKTQVEKANVIMVGGGNTFQLLKKLYDLDLMDLIRQRVEAGTPYIGWSAGSNIAGPSIRTTNDMPIVEPPTFKALNLIPWQVNPHYIENNPPGHNGETRQQRIEEYLKLNPDNKVIALPEGTGLSLNKSKLYIVSNEVAYVYSRRAGYKVEKTEFDFRNDLNTILEKW
ncbi:MAG: dipeptidase PepE [Enterobacterales bacterium]|nr:dipeptidase PepE [Enterobacterales bacterium]